MADSRGTGPERKVVTVMSQRHAAHLPKITEEKVKGNPLASLAEEQWKMRTEVYTLIKRKTEVASEARKIVETVPHENGYEAFRILGLRYEPQTGLKRLIEMSEINQLQNKRCQTAVETALVVLEIERRMMRILEIGGHSPPCDTLATVLWAAMDPNIKVYVAGKLARHNRVCRIPSSCHDVHKSDHLHQR